MKIPETCLECDKGNYEVVAKPYESRGQDGNVIVVPDVKFLCCTQCGEELIPAESSRYISRYVAEANEQLTKVELFAMLEASGLSQKDFAEAIGLGEKTFHRWLKGTQVVSRSMGYYLRAMERFPEVFAWVKERDWRKPAPARVYTPATKTEGNVFTALQRRHLEHGNMIRPRLGLNPARALVLEAVHHSRK